MKHNTSICLLFVLCTACGVQAPPKGSTYLVEPGPGVGDTQPPSQAAPFTGLALRTADDNGVLSCLSADPNAGVTAQVRLTDCSAATDMWTLTEGRLRLAQTNACLVALDMALGAGLALAPCDASANTERVIWDISPTGKVRLSASPNAPSGSLCLLRVGGTGLTMGDCNRAALFALMAKDGGVRLRSAQNPLRCLTLQGDPTTGAAVQMAACNSDRQQTWIPWAGTVQAAANPKFCLSALSGDAGTALQLIRCEPGNVFNNWWFAGASAALQLAAATPQACVAPAADVANATAAKLGDCQNPQRWILTGP